MESTLMFVAVLSSVLCLLIGAVAGWFANDVVYNYIQQATTPRLHPELEGISVSEELYAVKFTNQEDDEEDDYY